MNRLILRIFVLALSCISVSSLAFENGYTLYSDSIQVGAYIKDPRPLVIAGVKRYGWAIDKDVPGVLSVRYEHLATVIEADIHYDQSAVLIKTEGAKSKPGCVDNCVIHKRSDNWITNIRRAIALEFHAFAIADAGGQVEGRYQEVDRDEFRNELMSDDARDVKLAALHVSKGYVWEQDFLDLAAQRLWDLHDTDDRELSSAAAHLAKALAQNGGARYESLIQRVAEQAASETLRRHATAALDNIIPAKNPVASFEAQ